jgi:hypothetical protein
MDTLTNKGMPVRLAVMGLLALPEVAGACSLCMESLVYSTMPWLPFAFLVLMAWFIVDWATRMHTENHPMPDGRGWPSMHTMIVVPIISVVTILFMGSGFFLAIVSTYLIYRLARELWRPTWPLVSKGRLIAVLSALAVIAAIGVWHRSQLSTFQVYERYVWSGTRVSDSMSTTLAEDSDFDVELLRPLLESTEWHRADMAFFVLEKRRDPKDLVRFAEVIRLRLPETAPLAAQPWKYEDFYLNRWLEQLDLQHIRTRADLDEWLDGQVPDAVSPQTDTEDGHIERASPIDP